MAVKRDSSRGLTDKKICLAVSFGVAFGVLFSLYHAKSGNVTVHQQYQTVKY